MLCNKIGSGKTLTGQSREIVYNVFNYFMHRIVNSESDERNSFMKNLYASTAEATGVSKRCVQRIVCEVRNQFVVANRHRQHRNLQYRSHQRNNLYLPISSAYIFRVKQPISSSDPAASTSSSTVRVVLRTPGKNRVRLSKLTTVDSFDQEVIRRTIYDFHLVHKTFPTLQKLLEVLKDSLKFKGAIS
ncbi:uncharacterized protein LOC143917924 [Arctopsyche grandis]|uniref:uncharacterized protein LOC143917924 n=1 Tax=Arctopsyche grandis TaxID=121162 RepID=UPI00406D782A